MPILKVQLDTSRVEPSMCHGFLARASAGFAAVLDVPESRVRVYVVHQPMAHSAVGGAVAETDAPFFEFYLLKGRPAEHRTQLLALFTDLIEDCFKADRQLIRGFCHHVAPEDWCIAGASAAAIRAEEIASRASAF